MGRMHARRMGGDPSEGQAHDVLAAEAFAVPGPDPGVTHDVVLPADPSGITRPHDVLSAEEFALPAPPPHPGGISLRTAHRRTGPRVALAVSLGLLILALIRRRRSR